MELRKPVNPVKQLLRADLDPPAGAISATRLLRTGWLPLASLLALQLPAGPGFVSRRGCWEHRVEKHGAVGMTRVGTHHRDTTITGQNEATWLALQI